MQKMSKAELAKIKVHKDFSFLLQIKPEQIHPKVTKYLLKEGIEKPINQESIQLDAYYSYEKYDYEGKLIQAKKHAQGKVQTKEKSFLKDAIFSMKILEEAWFNIQDQHQEKQSQVNDQPTLKETQPLNQKEKENVSEKEIVEKESVEKEIVEKEIGEKEIIEKEIVEKEIVEKEIVEKEIVENISQKNLTGFHYLIKLEKIQVKYDQSMPSKRKLFEQNRQKGKQYFSKRNYETAFKIYKQNVDITEGYQKKKFGEGEIKEMEEMNLKSKHNVLKCFNKMELDDIDKDMKELVEQYIEFLVKKKSKDYETHYLKAKYLMKTRYFSDALELAKKTQGMEISIKGNSNQTNFLIKEIEMEIAHKGKIKIKK